MFHGYRPRYEERRAFMGIARPAEPDPRLAPLETLAQQVLGRAEDDFHWTVTELAQKLWGELRDIYLLTEHEGDAQGWFTATRYIRRNLRGPLEAAGLIQFRDLPDNRIEQHIRITAAGSALLGEPHPISQETLMLEAVQITPGCVPGIDYPPFELEYEPIIVGDHAHIYVPCDACGSQYVSTWPRGLWEQYGTAQLYRWAFNPLLAPRLCPGCLPGVFARAAEPANEENGEIVNSIGISDGDTEPLELPPTPPQLDTTIFFHILNDQFASALASLEGDRMVIARGHRDALETIKRYLVSQQEQTNFLHYQVGQLRDLLERQRDITSWWRSQAERHLAIADRHADTIMQLEHQPDKSPSLRSGEGLGVGMPHLSLVDVETLDDLAQHHTGGRLAGLLAALHLPELDEFRTAYPVLHEAKAAIGKRIVDYSYAVMAYHVACSRSRGGKPYLTLDFGFGTVNVFDRFIKEHFVKYPGGYDHWLAEGFEQELDPPVQLILTRDAKRYTQIDSLFVVE